MFKIYHLTFNIAHLTNLKLLLQLPQCRTSTMVEVLYVLGIIAYITQSIAFKTTQDGSGDQKDQDIMSDGDAYIFYKTFIGASSNNISNQFANVTLIVYCRQTSAVCKSCFTIIYIYIYIYIYSYS